MNNKNFAENFDIFINLNLKIKKSRDIDRCMLQLKLNEGSANLFYWFASDNGKIVADYGERVFDNLFNPNHTWTMVVLGVEGDIDANNKNFENVVAEINRKLGLL